MGTKRPQRKNIRLPGFDYSLPGGYFITICTKDRVFLLDPAPARGMIQKWWDELPRKFGNVEIDEFVIMPNHIHGIIVLKDPEIESNMGEHMCPPILDGVRANLCVDPHESNTDGCADPGGHVGPPLPDGVRADLRVGPCAAPLPTIIQWFKTMTTNEYIRGVKHLGWPPFPGKLWQRNYYEHILRNSREYEAIRHYIRENPLQWASDRNNPTNNAGWASETAGDVPTDIQS